MSWKKVASALEDLKVTVGTPTLFQYGDPLVTISSFFIMVMYNKIASSNTKCKRELFGT